MHSPCALVAGMGVIIARYLEGSSGTITATSIAVTPARFCGIRLPGPSGQYPIDGFTAVRVGCGFAPVDGLTQGGPPRRVYLLAGGAPATRLNRRAPVEDGGAGRL